MTRAILNSPSVATPDNGDLLAPVVAYLDASGRLWAGTEGCTPAPVAEVTPLPAAGLVVVTAGAPGDQEVYLLAPDEWHGIKAAAAPLPQLSTPFGLPLALDAGSEEAAL